MSNTAGGLGSEDIERIVQEVIRRLLSAGVQVQSPKVSLELNERLITTAKLHGKLANIDELVVPSHAVVTPLVRDELRDKKVELVRKPIVDE